MPGIGDVIQRQKDDWLARSQTPTNRFGVGNWQDPTDISRGAGGVLNKGLYGDLDRIMGLLNPLFKQQTGNLRREQGSSLLDARRAGGEYASARGISNPYALISKGQGQVYDAYAPQFGKLLESQTGQALNSTAQSNQFDLNGLMGMLGSAYGNEQLQMQKDASEFNFFRDLLPGLLSGGGSVLGAGIGRANNPWF